MSGLFFTLALISAGGVLATLGVGLFGMARAGDFNRRHGNRLMRLRVLLQGAAIVFLLLAVAGGD